ncbi:hypothetical protein DPMN_052327 [Dreissena polymorpha]|uniref:Uncharacterized protein n=1 Tax=Dreissena polymorpha TaxID=45954 RepID=A0A9D4HPS4_DREPO|nr:hypothetical protein DPMN_052327 [Dreissena polymorpha]
MGQHLLMFTHQERLTTSLTVVLKTIFTIKQEGVRSKKTRRTMSAVVSGQAIAEPHTEAKMLKHQEDQGYNKTPKKLSNGQKSVKKMPPPPKINKCA